MVEAVVRCEGDDDRQLAPGEPGERGESRQHQQRDSERAHRDWLMGVSSSRSVRGARTGRLIVQVRPGGRLTSINRRRVLPRTAAWPGSRGVCAQRPAAGGGTGNCAGSIATEAREYSVQRAPERSSSTHTPGYAVDDPELIPYRRETHGGRGVGSRAIARQRPGIGRTGLPCRDTVFHRQCDNAHVADRHGPVVPTLDHADDENIAWPGGGAVLADQQSEHVEAVSFRDKCLDVDGRKDNLAGSRHGRGSQRRQLCQHCRITTAAFDVLPEPSLPCRNGDRCRSDPAIRAIAGPAVGGEE